MFLFHFIYIIFVAMPQRRFNYVYQLIFAHAEAKIVSNHISAKLFINHINNFWRWEKVWHFYLFVAATSRYCVPRRCRRILYMRWLNFISCGIFLLNYKHLASHINYSQLFTKLNIIFLINYNFLYKKL